MIPSRLVKRYAARVAFLGTVCAGSGGSLAAWQGTGPLSDYQVNMDNGVVYVVHPAFVTPCTNSRLEIRSSEPYSLDYAKRLTAMLIAAHLTGKRISVSWNDATAPACILNGLAVER
jgi:hypothetical protein